MSTARGNGAMPGTVYLVGAGPGDRTQFHPSGHVPGDDLRSGGSLPGQDEPWRGDIGVVARR